MKETNDIPALISFVRKHQEYKSEAFRIGTLDCTSISDWLFDAQISKGPYAVRGAALRKLYIDWCRAQNMDESLIAKKKSFHSTMKQILEFHLKKDNLFYYVNKKVIYEPQKKPKDQAAAQEDNSEATEKTE